jgi:hypothetical protein
MVEKSIPLCKPTSGRSFRPGADRRGHLLLERGSIRLLLLTLSPPPPRHDTATAPGCRRSQAEAGVKGQESTSRAVHRRFVLPAAMAGVRWRECCARRLPPRSRGCSSLTRSDTWGRDIRESTLATTPDRPAAGERASPSPRFVEPARLLHVGRSDSPAQ